MLNGARMANRSRVLVTGGAGFIGRRVVRALLAEGHEVTVADLRAFPDTAVRSVIGDLCGQDVPARAVRPGTDVIIHLAAITSVLASVQDPVSTHRLNVDVTARLLELARENEVETFLLASTNAVVGAGSAPGEIITERTVLRPLTPYGATKAAAEMLLGSYANCYGITGAALRFSNVYGPGMAEKDSFIPRLMRAARDGEGLPARVRPGIRHGDGLAGFCPREGVRVIYSNPQDQVVDDTAIKVFTDAYGERATSLPLVAIVIAAYNEEGAIGPVIQALPAEVCG